MRLYFWLILISLFIEFGSARRYAIDDEGEYGKPVQTQPSPSSDARRGRQGSFMTGWFAFLAYNSDADLLEKTKRVPAQDLSIASLALIFFPFETCGLATLCLGLVAYFANGRLNRMMVTTFLRNNLALLSREFHRFDVGDVSAKGATILTDGSDHFVVYASGRRHVKACRFTFELAPRQNIFYWAAQVCRIRASEDVLTLEASLTTKVPFSLVLAPKVKDMNSKISEQPVLSRLPLKVYEKAFGLSCVSDSFEIASMVLKPTSEKSLRLPMLRTLLISDQLLSLKTIEARKSRSDDDQTGKGALFEGGQMISMSLTLQPPTSSERSEVRVLIEFFFDLVDCLSELEVPSSVRRRGEALRQGLLDKLKAAAQVQADEDRKTDIKVDELLS